MMSGNNSCKYCYEHVHVCMYLSKQVAVGQPSKAKRYCMKSGTKEQFVANLEKQFPTERKSIAKLMKLLEVRAIDA